MFSKFFSYLFLIFIFGCSAINGTGGTIDETVPSKTQKSFIGKVDQVNTKNNEIKVNGVLLNHSNAIIKRNNTILDHNSIVAGQIVSIETSSANKKGIYQAQEIEIQDQLIGSIEAIDTKANTLLVLGQMVFVLGSTNFLQKNFNALKVGNYLSVFGFRNKKGYLEATLIECIKDNFVAIQDPVKISGEVNSINTEKNIIEINNIFIQLDATNFNNIQVGDFLTLDNLILSTEILDGNLSNILLTSNVKGIKNYAIDEEIVLEGIPSQILAKNLFSLNGYQVFVPLDLLETNKLNSIDAKQIIVEGVFVGKKDIVAKNIHFAEAKDFEFRGLIEDASENEITEDGYIIVFGQRVVIDKYTSIDFELEDILNFIKSGLSSYTVYIKGYLDNTGTKIASSISLKKDESDITKLISGKIESIGDGVITVSQFSIKLNDTIEFENEDATINSSILINKLTVGEYIELFGSFNQEGIFLANSLEIINIIEKKSN